MNYTQQDAYHKDHIYWETLNPNKDSMSQNNIDFLASQNVERGKLWGKWKKEVTRTLGCERSSDTVQEVLWPEKSKQEPKCDHMLAFSLLARFFIQI
jgi:hypothetical protein